MECLGRRHPGGSEGAECLASLATHRFRTFGASDRRNDDYEDAALRVEDLHPGNVLIAAHGELIVIDPAIFPRPL